MKKVNILVALVAAFVSFSSCEKCVSDCNLIPAKIIRFDCDRVILQVLTAQAVGDSSWEDIQTGKRYSNVVSYYNTCQIMELTKGEKLTLYVSLAKADGSPKIPNCVRCEALSQHPPQTLADFLKVSVEPCQRSHDL